MLKSVRDGLHRSHPEPGLLATALFASGHYLGMRIGGMERLAAYPLPIWTIVMGSALRRHGGQVRTRSDIPSKG
jgi:hypothetical protein